MPSDSGEAHDHVVVVLRGPDGKIKDSRGAGLRDRLVRLLHAFIARH